MIGIFINLWNRLTGGGTPAPTPALLDTYGGAAAAFSLRKLSSTYGGSAVRVRRSLDNSEQDIGFSGDNLDETALQAFVGYENLFLVSESFTSASWGKSSSTVTANAGTDPFGGNNATRYLANTGTSSYWLDQNIALTVGQSYTMSVWVKSNTGVNQTFRIAACNSVISSGAFTATNDWQRFTFSFVAVAGAFQSIISTNFVLNLDVLIFGAQLNQGVTAQTYQQTGAARNTANGFVTKWYTQDGNGENLLLQSNSFTVSPWIGGKGGTGVFPVITPNAGTDPFGGSTATRLVLSTGGGTTSSDFSFLIQSVTAGTSRNYSIWMKSFSGANQTISIYVGGGILGATFTVTSSWQRFSFNYVPSGNRLQLVLAGTDGSGTSDILIYGAQISNGTWLQGYQATTTTAVSRRDASQATAASQPRIVNAGVIERENGKASIRFDGVDDFLSLASDITYTTTGNQYVSAVFTPATAITASTAAYGILNANATVDTRILYFIGNTTGALTNERVAFLKPNSGLFIGYGQTITDLSATPKLQSISFDPPSLFNIFQNSIQQQFVQTDNGPLSASQYPSTFGRIGANQVGSAPFFGDMQEIILYGTSRSANRADIDRNVGAYYQTQWTGASSGLLDQFGGAAAAYSLRNLSSSYRGPLIRVRRSSDNAETDIGGTYSGDLDVASLLSFTGGQNLLAYSEDFTNATWNKSSTIATANSTIAPNGTLTANKLTETATTSDKAVAVFTTAALSNNASIYLKAAERNLASLTLYRTISPFANFSITVDLITGQFKSDSYFGGIVFNASVTSAGNGWWRVSVSGTINVIAACGYQVTLLTGTLNNPTPSHLGVSNSGIYIWGAQLTTGSILQSYVPTLTASPINGANAFVTKWYDQSGIGDNLVLQSETFGNASWTKSQCTVSENVAVDPFGGNNADKILENGLTAQNPALTQTSLSMVAGTTYVFSCYLKAAERNFAFVDINNGLLDYTQLIDLTTGSVVANINNPPYVIENAGNGWWRLAVFFTPTTNSTATVIIGPKLTAAYGTYNTTLNSGILIFGAQFSASSQLLRYQPTTTAAAPKRDAVQTTAASQPRIVNAGSVESENGKPSIFFDGTDDTLLTPTAVIRTNEFSSYAVVSSSSTVSTTIIAQHDGTALANRTSFLATSASPDSGKAVLFTNDGTTTYILSTASNSVFNGTSSIIFSNAGSGTGSIGFRGVLESSSAIPSWVPVNVPLAIGSVVNQSFFSGDIQELMLYPTKNTLYQSISSNQNSFYQSYWQGNGTALLDSYSGASAAYSLRNLSSAYTGPLIRVRRSSDNVERDIFGTFRGDLDLAALTSFVGANSGFVTTWYDQSGTGRHATQATAASQPRIVNAGDVDTLGGKPSLIFDGTNDFMSFADLTAPQFTSFYPQKKDANADRSAWFTTSNALGGSPYTPILFGTGGIYIGNGSSSFISNPYQNNDYILMTGYINATNQGFIQINGNNLVMVPHAETAFSNVFNRINARTGINQYSKCSVPEMILYAFDNSANLPPINNSINNYYKIY